MEARELENAVRRACRRDPVALAWLVEAYSPRVYGFLLRLSGSPEAAEDLMQETFLRVVRTIGDYVHAGRFEPWLFRIAANLVRDHNRWRQRHPVTVLDEEGMSAVEGQPAVAGGDPAARLADQEVAARLSACLDRLGAHEREVLSLRHYGGLSFREIGELLEIPLGTALARAHRGLQHLKAALELGTAEPAIAPLSGDSEGRNE